MKNSKKLIQSYTVLVLFLLIIPVISSYSIDVQDTKEVTKKETKSWTALYYIDVDFNGARNGDALEWIFLKEIASKENLSVLALQDKELDPAMMYYIDENHDAILLEELGEVNMGDPQTLIDFISYAKEYYPAERYQLCLFGHANAWYGACNDDTNEGDIITMDEFQQSLRETDGIDLMSFIGCCQMGSLESVYELKDFCDVYIASESSGHQNDWIGMMDDMCDLLNDNVQMSTIECGQQIVQLISDNENDNYDTMTISAIRTDKLSALVNALDSLCLLLYDNEDELYEHFKSAKDLTKQFPFIQDSCLLDLYDFIDHYLEIETDSRISNCLHAIKANLSDAIIAECHGLGQSGAHGLSIFYSKKDLISLYSNYELDFTRDTRWDELLDNHKENIRMSDRVTIISKMIEKYSYSFSLLDLLFSLFMNHA